MIKIFFVFLILSSAYAAPDWWSEWQKNVENFSEQVEDFWGGVANKTQNFVDKTQAALKNVQNLLGEATNNTQEFFQDVTGNYQQYWDENGDEFFNYVVQLTKDIVDDAVNGRLNIYGNIKDVIHDAIDKAAENFDNVDDQTVQKVKDVMDIVVGATQLVG